MITNREALAEGAGKLAGSDPHDNRRTARILLSRVLGTSQERLLARPDERITAHQYSEYLELITRRASGEPLQHLTGHQEFYGLDFLVSPDVLIPRPETEFLVEQVLGLAASVNAASSDGVRLIVDVGTGSGCIAIALAIHLPMARIIATDISQPALDMARKNAAMNGVADRIQFLPGDLLSPLEQYRLDGSVDFIACNPPYVPASRPDLVQRGVRDFEPVTALFGGTDGLAFYRRLLVDALPLLMPGGCLVCEIGFSQLDSVRAIVDSTRWELLDPIEDLQGIPRTLTLKKR